MSPTAAGRVVVGVDGSPDSERAVRWAAEQARLEQRELLVVAAVPPHRAPTRRGGAARLRSVTRHAGLAVARAVAQDGVRLACDLHPMLDASARAVVGDPREVLVEMSREAHVVVVGSRGRGALRSLLLGSVSTAVLKQADCPVVVCRPERRAQRAHGILVAADGTPESLPVIEFAFQQAAARDLPLTVIHCFWDVVAAVAGFRQGSGEMVNEPQLEELRLVLAESVAGFGEKFPDVRVEVLLRHGLVDEALSDRHKDWDLIVVGRHPVVGLTRMLTGSIATAVVERAHSNVAVVPEAPSAAENDE